MSLSRAIALLVLIGTGGSLTAQAGTGRGDVVVLSGAAPPYLEAAKAAARCLDAQGYRVRTVVEADFGTWDPAKSPVVAALVVGSQAANLVRSKAADVPMTYCMVADVRAAGLEGQAKVQGVTSAVPLLPQFELIQRALPAARKVGMLYRSGVRGSMCPEDVQAVLPATLTLHAVDLAKAASVAAGIDELLAGKVDIVWAAPDTAVFDSATVKTLLLRALRTGTPVFGFSDSFVKAGALLGVNVDPARQGEQASELLLGLLRDDGTAANKAAVPPMFTVGVNFTVARHLGIAIPDAVAKEAKLVVEAR